MPYSTTKANLLHLHTFVTRHPEVPAKVASLLEVPLDIAGKLSSFAAAYQTELVQQTSTSDAFLEGKTKLASLESSLTADAEHLEKLFEIYGARSGQVTSFPQFVKRGGFEANLREFLAALAPHEASIQTWDVQGILPKLTSDFAEYTQYAATQSEKEIAAGKESADVNNVLSDAEGFILLARDLLRRTCALYFPDLLVEMVMYHHAVKVATIEVPIAPPA